MNDLANAYPAPPLVVGEEMIDNDLLPWSHHLTAHNLLDVFAGGGSGVQRLVGTAWPFSILSYTTVQTTGEMGWYIATAAGTWSIQMVCALRNDYGISQLRVDGVATGSNVDLYAAATQNYRMHRVDGVVLTRGEHLFTLKQTGTKNAASSAYLQTLSGISLTRTA